MTSDLQADFLGTSDDAPEDAKPSTPSPDDNLLQDLKSLIHQQSDAHPRSQQKTLGPSEIGTPCARRLAASLLQFDQINPDGDPLPSWLGTAGHARLEDAVALDNERTPGRWLSERRVTVREGLSGTCDLYDTRTNTVIDFKFVGTTKAADYRKNGPSPEYKVQAHCYGRGYRNEGFPVERVGIWFLPRAGFLSRSWIWTEEYSDQVVDDVLAKLDNIMVLINDLQIEDNPSLLAVVPKTPHGCMYCPWFVPRPDAAERPQACTGAAK
jgi:hypothetical protein